MNKTYINKKPKFDPKTLRPFDRVLTRDLYDCQWCCGIFSHIGGPDKTPCIYVTTESCFEYCIPYNDDTKHLVGTAEEAPEFYRYWEE